LGLTTFGELVSEAGRLWFGRAGALPYGEAVGMGPRQPAGRQGKRVPAPRHVRLKPDPLVVGGHPYMSVLGPGWGLAETQPPGYLSHPTHPGGCTSGSAAPNPTQERGAM
jgi:hypothetical protein